jgi:hypothetical protein
MVDRKPGSNRAVVADGLAHLVQGLAPEAGAVLERAAVLVAAAVIERGKELEGKVGVCAVHVDDVEPGVTRP